MNRWSTAIVLCGLFLNCIPYIRGPRYERIVRVAIVTGADSVRVSGSLGNKYYEEVIIKTSDSLPIFLRPHKNIVKVNSKSYYGNLEIKRINNKVWVINILDIEDYLKGVVPCELGRINKDLIEAAKAQAIAARTYTYAHLNKYQDLGFDLYATVQDQVYMGIQVEDPLINQAILKTRGLILVYNGEPVEAKYHSTCGGNTADYNDAWQGNSIPYLQGVRCDFCKMSPNFYWKKEFKRQDFFRILRKNIQMLGMAIPDAELIKTLKFKRNTRSRRIIEVRIVTHRKEYIIPAYNIRRLFGSETDPGGLLKSNNFTIHTKDDLIIIEGYGFGHGVGMCQFGAMGMAKQGKNYRNILKHYYTGTKISKL